MTDIRLFYDPANLPEVERRLYRHIVTMHCVDRAPVGPKDPSRPVCVLAFSGFLYMAGNRLLWVTAGHVIRGLAAKVNAQELIRVHLNDGLHRPMPGQLGIPTSLDLRRGVWVDDDESGIDIGAYELGLHEAALFTANGTLPLTEEDVGDLNETAAHVVIGFPECARSFTCERTARGFEGTAELGTLLLPLQVELRSKPEHHLVHRQHYKILPHKGVGPGRAPDTIENAEGMSGGPVFQLVAYDSGKWSYQLVGVQCAQDNNTRHLIATPAKPLLDAIVARLSGAVGEQVHS